MCSFPVTQPRLPRNNSSTTLSLPKPLPIQHPRSPHKLPRRNLLPPLLLDARDPQLAASPANHSHPTLLHQYRPRLPSRRAAHRPPPQMPRLSPKFRIRPPPRRKPPHPVVNLRRCPPPLNPSILPLQHRRQRSRGMILRPPRQLSLRQSPQRLHHQRRSHLPQPPRQLRRRLFRSDPQLFLQQHLPRIHPRINPHRRISRNRLPARNRPLNRRRPAILRQQGSMQIDPPQSRNRQQPRRNNLPVRNNHNRVRRHRPQVLFHLRRPHLRRLPHIQPRRHRHFLHR